jgi:hypothetical protein
VLKLHRRIVPLGGRDHTVLTLRPDARVRFSTNYYHDTWHVLSDVHGAQVLARLLWGLSYQARPGTLILLDEARLDPNPFDAEPPRLVALIPAGLTSSAVPLLRELKRSRHRHTAPAGTVRWRTNGLDAALARYRATRDYDLPGLPTWRRHRTLVEDVRELAGVVTLTAEPAMLRILAFAFAKMADYWYRGQCSLELDDYAGELQIWRDYHRMVSIARTARAEVLSTGAGADPAEVRLRVWRHAVAVRRRRYGLPPPPPEASS